MSEIEEKHGMNCPGLIPSQEDECTCGLEWRIRLQTEQSMHNAWRKRAEEAEAALAGLKGERDRWHEEYQDANNQRFSLSAALSQAQQALRKRAIEACSYWVSEDYGGPGHSECFEETVNKTIAKWLAEAALPSDAPEAANWEHDFRPFNASGAVRCERCEYTMPHRDCRPDEPCKPEAVSSDKETR